MNPETLRAQAETVLNQLRRDKEARQLAGFAAIAAAFLLIASPWLLIPGLFALGFGLLGWFPFFPCAAFGRTASSDVEPMTERVVLEPTLERDPV